MNLMLSVKASELGFFHCIDRGMADCKVLQSLKTNWKPNCMMHTQRFFTCVSADCFSAPLAECFPLNRSRRVYQLPPPPSSGVVATAAHSTGGRSCWCLQCVSFPVFISQTLIMFFDELKLEHCLVGYCRFSLRVEELSQDVEERRLKGLSFIHNYYIQNEKYYMHIV